jgi:hypothetical protein
MTLAACSWRTSPSELPSLPDRNSFMYNEDQETARPVWRLRGERYPMISGQVEHANWVSAELQPWEHLTIVARPGANKNIHDVKQIIDITRTTNDTLHHRLLYMCFVYARD